MIRFSALLSAIAFALAACRPRPGLTHAPPPAPTEVRSQPTVEVLAPEEILKRSREVMDALSSFEVQMMRLEPSLMGSDSDPLDPYQMDIRWERPDRHSFLIYYRPGGFQGLADAQPLEAASEIRRIGASMWTRRDLATGGQWTCEVYDHEPPSFDYAPGPDAIFVGLEDTSFGPRYHFRSQREGHTGDYWIDARTWHVVQSDSLSFEEDGRITLWDSRRLSAFDTPRQIFPPGPCRLGTPTPETDGSED